MRRSQRPQEAERETLRRDPILAAALTLPVFVLEMYSHLIPAVHDLVRGHHRHVQASWYIQFALTLLVLAIPSIRFYQKAFLPCSVAPDMVSPSRGRHAGGFVIHLSPPSAPYKPAGTVNVYYEAAAYRR